MTKICFGPMRARPRDSHDTMRSGILLDPLPRLRILGRRPHRVRQDTLVDSPFERHLITDLVAVMLAARGDILGWCFAFFDDLPPPCRGFPYVRRGRAHPRLPVVDDFPPL